MAEDTQADGGAILEVPKKESDPVLAEINKKYNLHNLWWYSMNYCTEFVEASKQLSTL